MFLVLMLILLLFWTAKITIEDVSILYYYIVILAAIHDTIQYKSTNPFFEKKRRFSAIIYLT